MAAKMGRPTGGTVIVALALPATVAHVWTILSVAEEGDEVVVSANRLTVIRPDRADGFGDPEGKAPDSIAFDWDAADGNDPTEG
jgi:hypothetical protein